MIAITGAAVHGGCKIKLSIAPAGFALDGAASNHSNWNLDGVTRHSRTLPFSDSKRAHTRPKMKWFDPCLDFSLLF
jgi:hypothetical protein